MMLNILEKNNVKKEGYKVEIAKLSIQEQIHQMLNSINISNNSKIFTSLDSLHNIIHKK